MPIQTNDNIYEMFRKARNQTLLPSDETNTKKEKIRRQTDYEAFLLKYNDLENEIDNLTTKDLVFYFRETATQAGYKYVIANIPRDLSMFKKVMANYSNYEICIMIEFLFLSNQDYLRKRGLSPTILVSNWCNTIYADSQLWVDDKFIPKSKSKPLKPVREWTGSKEQSSVGKWRK